jgi:enoyl-CoA hydratase/carnithine racemase
MQLPKLSTLSVALVDHVGLITLSRPDRANAMNDAMWQELREAMRWLDSEPLARVGIIEGRGDHFCAGIDLAMLISLPKRIEDECAARSAEKLRLLILDLQDTLTAIERCRKPVIAAVHGACVGGGLDLAAACDLRYCSSDAKFCLKEIDLGIVADVGVIQRLTKIIGDGRTRELAFTARSVGAEEAARIGLVSGCLGSREQMRDGVMDVARLLASRSPIAIRGLKENLVYARDHSVPEGLRYAATWNSAMLMSRDLEAVAMAQISKSTPKFKD